MKKEIRFYLHHNHFEPVTYKKRSGVFGFMRKVLISLANAIALFCYLTGTVIINLLLLPVLIYRVVANLPKIIQSLAVKLRIASFRRAVAMFALLAVVAGSGVHGLGLIAAGQNIKGQVLGTSDAGLNYLQEAKTSLESQNTAAAQANFTKALEQFKTSEESLDSVGVVLKGLLIAVPQKHDADKLLNAAQLITEAGIKGTELIALTENLKLSAVGLSNGPENKELLLKAQTLLNESVDLANQAASEINSVSISSIPEQYQPGFVAAKDIATLFQNNITALKDVCTLVFDLLLGNKNMLLVFQNNNELRASGGFMGTIGNAKLVDGSLTSLDIRSVYDWDGQLKDKIMPPQPMLAVNNRWYLRDSNWFAHFPQSASRISTLYEKEGGETPDLIIAMTPDVIIDMLERTGPIQIPQHGVTLTAENFVELTQTETSVNYDKELNQPKQFLADFFPILMEKLGTSGGIMTFLEIFQQNLYQKQIVMYSRNSDLQKKISSFNWAGELRDTDRDFLSVVNSNLGGTKTDRFLERHTGLESNIDSDGTVTNTIRYTVKNPLPNTEGLKNKSFVRFYVPEGSILLGSEGFNKDFQLPIISEDGYVVDEQVQEWQRFVTQDTFSRTFTGRETDKTWFGNWLEVAGGESKTVTITYQLPFSLSKIDRHSILIQKQPGSRTAQFDYALTFDGRNSLWKSNSASLENKTLRFSGDLMADAFIGTVMEKK